MEIDHPKHVLEENGMRAEFVNERRIRFSRARVDGCLLSSEDKACDYFVKTDSAIWFVELKGKHVSDAVNQIVVSIGRLEGEIGDRVCVPVIVAAQCPAVSQHT